MHLNCQDLALSNKTTQSHSLSELVLEKLEIRKTQRGQSENYQKWLNQKAPTAAKFITDSLDEYIFKKKK